MDDIVAKVNMFGMPVGTFRCGAISLSYRLITCNTDKNTKQEQKDCLFVVK